MLLVALRPFHVLTRISPDVNLNRGHASYSVSWAMDSSAVLINVQAKWGPNKVLLLPIHDGRPGKITDLAAVVEKLVRPVYRRAKARRHGEVSVELFNDERDFIFESEYEPLGSQESTRETWSAEESGRGAIVCFCTNNPKIADTHTWAVRFEGVWDIARGRFTRHRMRTMHPTIDKDESRRG